MKKMLYLWLLISHWTVYAQTKKSDSIPTKELEEVVIQAVRSEAFYPVTSKIVSQTEIEKVYFGQDAATVIEQTTPSLVLYSDAGTRFGNYNLFRLRGIDQTRINMTLNGVPLNDMIDQGVFFSNFSDFANSIRSFEVQRGVGTSTNGTASYGGSVNFQSVKLTDPEPSYELNLVGGSFDTYRAAAEIKTGLMKNNTAFYGRYSRTLSGGFKNHSSSDAQSFFFSGGYFGNNDVLKITAFAGKTENDQSYLPVPISVINEDEKTNLNNDNDTDDFEQEMIQIQYSRAFNNKTSINTTLYYGGSRGFFPFSLNDTSQLVFGLRNNHFGLIGDIAYNMGDLSFTGGMHAYTFLRKNEEWVAPNSSNPYYDDNSTKNELSLFAKANYKLGKLNIFSDLQLRLVSLEFDARALEDLTGNQTKTRDFAFFNPKIGFGYQLTNNSSIYASYGRASREPARTDFLGQDASSISAANVNQVVNESLVREERVNDYEAGYKYTSDKLHIKGNFFHMDFKDEIAPVGEFIADAFIQLKKNIPESFRQGVELEIEYKPINKLSVNNNITYLNTNVSSFFDERTDQTFDDVRHIFAPTWNTYHSITYNLNKQLTINFSGRYNSESFLELSNRNDLVLPSYFIMDSRINYQLSEKYQISLMLNNIFDERYFTNGAPVDLDFDGVNDEPAYNIQSPRSFFLQFKMTL
ncbi:MAG TPA: TonB-dependent receptor [Cyclobacteriaceae bacterium]